MNPLTSNQDRRLEQLAHKVAKDVMNMIFNEVLDPFSVRELDMRNGL